MDTTSHSTSASELKDRCHAELTRCQELLRAITEAVGPRTRANTLEPLDGLCVALGNAWNFVGLTRCVHPSAAVRTAAEESEKEIARFASDLGLNREVWEAVSRSDRTQLDPAGIRMVEHVLRDFRRSGVDRDEATRERVRALREELVTIGQEFLRNILSDVRSIVLDDAGELAGLPEDYSRSHPPGPDEKIRITTDYPDYNPFMTYGRSSARRRELYTEFRRRAYPANLSVLDGLLRRRHELARLLGYPSWASYVTEDKMIRTPDAVASFIARVSEAARDQARREYEVLLDRKRIDEPSATEVADWEKGYYEELVKSERFHVDSKEVRGYFDYGRVRDGILSLTEELFGVRFRAAPDVPRWHPDVEVLDVFEDGSRVGRVYLDMHPREGKFKHAAMFPLARGVRGRAVPEAALVCNFPAARDDGPALLEHDAVVTFFHEFGHLLHHLFARDNQWARFNGTATEWDFVEVPSQLYEEWAWDPDVLRRFAVHHRTGEVIPVDLVERMRRARGFGRALWVRHQMFYASVSLECYGRDPEGLDTSSLVQEVQDEFSCFRFVEGTYFQASFGHLDDYSALYYTYMWSLVIEKDIFSRFRSSGAMSRDAAAHYRDRILAPGGSADAMELVRSFLGRDYSFEAFERWLAAP